MWRPPYPVTALRESLAECERELFAAKVRRLSFWVGVYSRKVRDLRTILARVGERVETGPAAAVEA